MPSLEQLQNLLAADESDSFVLYAIAQEHAKRSEHDLAVTFYDRCVAVEPGELYAYFHKARSLEAMGRPDEAAACLRLGAERAQAAGDAKALGEITGYLQSLGAA